MISAICLIALTYFTQSMCLDNQSDGLQDDTGKKTCFIDSSVYTKNRAFRLMLSSKAGKETVLQPTGQLGLEPSLSLRDRIALCSCVDPSVELAGQSLRSHWDY